MYYAGLVLLLYSDIHSGRVAKSFYGYNHLCLLVYFKRQMLKEELEYAPVIFSAKKQRPFTV